MNKNIVIKNAFIISLCLVLLEIVVLILVFPWWC